MHIYIYIINIHMYVYTHAHTHTHTHTFIHTSVYTHACMCTCVYADASSLPVRWHSALLRQARLPSRDGCAAPAARRQVRVAFSIQGLAY